MFTIYDLRRDLVKLAWCFLIADLILTMTKARVSIGCDLVIAGKPRSDAVICLFD